MKSIHILLVEDNDGDILLTTEALEECKLVNNVTVLKNGKEAIDYMQKKGKYVDVNFPDMVLLDVNLPLKSGHEVLQVIKNDDATKHIPVIMLTTSCAERDIMLSYKHYANAFITKPIDVFDFLKAITSIEQFWFNIVSLPSQTN